MSPRSAPRRALVTNGEGRATVAACRSLKEAGYCVSVVASARPAASHWSSACDEKLRLPDPVRYPGQFIDGLERVVLQRPCAVLLPGSDAALLAISSARERLEPHVRIGLPKREAVEASLDKIRLLDAAVGAGLPTPATAICESARDARAAALRFGFPVVLKPQRSIVDDRGIRTQISTRVVFDEAQLARMVPQYGLPFLVQAREPGPVYSCSGVMVPGGLLALVTSRYLRTWPPEGGEVSFSETLETPAGMAAAIEALISGLGWQGLFELELIRRADGSFATIDLNPRLYGSVAAAIASGAALPAIWCEWVLTGHGERPSPRAGVLYRWEEGELRHLLWQLRRRQVRRATAVLRPHRGLRHAYFRANDPGPLIARSLQLLEIARQRALTTPSRAARHT